MCAPVTAVQLLMLSQAALPLSVDGARYARACVLQAFVPASQDWPSCALHRHVRAFPSSTHIHAGCSAARPVDVTTAHSNGE